MNKLNLIFSFSFFILTQSLFADPTVLVPRESVWKFLDTGSSPAPAWKQISYNDSAWISGAAPLGYGDKGETTRVNYGGNPQNKFITTYFRQIFTAVEIQNMAYLVFHLKRDDGAVVYLNGVEMFRSNLPLTAITSNTLALASVAGGAETYFYQVPVPKDSLINGNNLIAVEVHQNSPSSSDLLFDLELQAWPQFPALALTAPGNGNLEVSWPNNPLGWQVYSKSKFDTNEVWVRWSAPVLSTNGNLFISVSGSEPQRFFRLQSTR